MLRAAVLEVTTKLKKEIYKKLLKDIEFYSQNYETIVEYKYTPNKGEQYLGDKENRICRFCNKDKTQTEFCDNPKNAHAIPQLLGNNEIFSYYECIPCNTFFAKYELELGAYTQPLRVALQIPGKKGYAHINDKQVWDNKEKRYIRKEIKRKSGLDEEKKEYLFQEKIPPYVPIKVTKAFVKIAMTLLPEEYTNHFQTTLKWLKSDSNDQLSSVDWGVTFTPGEICSSVNYATIIGKPDCSNKISCMYFVISIGNFMFQIPLELDKNDTDVKKNKIEVPIYPLHFIKFEDFYGQHKEQLVHFNKQQTWNIDMSSDQKIKEGQFSLTLGTGEIKKIPKEEGISILQNLKK